ncbi:MAG: hypothetical protein WDZ59_15620 [Pirellulales bacterium]
MRPHREILILLIVATLLVDMSALELARQITWMPGPTVELVLALSLSQVVLLTSWAVLGTSPFVLRMLGLAAGVAAWPWALESIFQLPRDNRWYVLFTTHASLALVGALWHRLRGIRWTVRHHSGHSRQQAASAAPWQFSLAHLFVIMSFAALAAVQIRQSNLTSAVWVHLMLLAGSSAAIGTVTIGTASGRLGGMPLAGTFLLAVVLGCGGAVMLGLDERFYTVICGLQPLLLLSWIAVAEMAGYRLVRTVVIERQPPAVQVSTFDAAAAEHGSRAPPPESE